jgi:hypothetical protein
MLSRMMDSTATPPRTVCHGCRQVTQYRAEDGTVRPMILPGSGVVFAEKAPGIMVEFPCPVCSTGEDTEESADGEDGDQDDPGWIPAFVPPA